MGVAKADGGILPKGVEKMYGDGKPAYKDPTTGVDNVEIVTRMLVLDGMRIFSRITGRRASVLYIPMSVEASLQIDRGFNFDKHERLRDLELLFGCKVVWDADEFRVE
jgi:hypothetical protein